MSDAVHAGRFRPPLKHGAAALLATALLGAAGCAQKLPRAVAERQHDAQSACAPVKLAASARFAADVLDTGLPTNGQWRDGFDLADLDGDGKLDLLHGPPRKGRGQPLIFRGDGSGHFSLWEKAHFPPLPYDYGDIKAADLNGDGRPDIALAAHLRGVAVLINEGQGHFAPWNEGLALQTPADQVGAPAFTSRALAVADWNRDGKPDLLALNEGPSLLGGVGETHALALWFNRDGLWDRAKPERPLTSFGDSIAAGDIDGDGDMDAVLGLQVSGARLALQLGDGNLFQSAELRSLPLDATLSAVALRDFDRDGRLEVIDGTRALSGGQFCTLLQVVHGAGSGREKPQALWSAVSRDPVVALAAGDIDGDGQDDLVAVRSGGEILSFAGTRRGFSRDLVIAPPAQMAECNAFGAVLADIDGDGRLELIVSYAGDDKGTGGPQCASGGGFRAWRLHAAAGTR